MTEASEGILAARRYNRADTVSLGHTPPPPGHSSSCLTDSQRAMIAARLSNLPVGGDGRNQHAQRVDAAATTRRDAAKACDVSVGRPQTNVAAATFTGDGGESADTIKVAAATLITTREDAAKAFKVAARLANMPPHRPSANPPPGGITCQPEAAKLCNVSARIVQRATHGVRKGPTR